MIFLPPMPALRRGQAVTVARMNANRREAFSVPLPLSTARRTARVRDDALARHLARRRLRHVPAPAPLARFALACSHSGAKYVTVVLGSFTRMAGANLLTSHVDKMGVLATPPDESFNVWSGALAKAPTDKHRCQPMSDGGKKRLSVVHQVGSPTCSLALGFRFGLPTFRTDLMAV